MTNSKSTIEALLKDERAKAEILAWEHIAKTVAPSDRCDSDLKKIEKFLWRNTISNGSHQADVAASLVLAEQFRRSSEKSNRVAIGISILGLLVAIASFVISIRK